MKPVYTVVLLSILWISFSACPYQSNVGIDTRAGIPIKTQFLGTWRTENYPDDSTEIKFTRLDNYKYLVQANVSDGASGYEFSQHQAWFSKVNNVMIMNFYALKDKFYHFGEVELANDELTIKLLSDYITKDQFASAAALRKFMENLYRSGKVEYDSDVVLEHLVKAE